MIQHGNSVTLVHDPFPLGSNRLDTMDSLRGIAAMWVTVFHFNEVVPFEPTAWRAFCKLGWLGVPIFFVISGWCMSAVSARETRAGAFLIARLIRIYFPYWCSLAIVCAVVLAHRLVGGTNDVTPLPKSPYAILATLTLWTSPASQVPTMNWVCWTLTLEITFYLFVFLGLTLQCPRVGVWLLVVSSVAFLLSEEIASRLYFGRHAGLFCAGFFAHSFSTPRQWLRLAAHCSLCLVLVFLATNLSGKIDLVPSQWCTVLAGGLTVCVLLLASVRSCLKHPKFLTAIGTISYSIYLLHVPLGVYGILLWKPGLNASRGWHLLYDLMALIAILLISMGFYKLIELPSHRFGKRVSSKWRSMGPAWTVLSRGPFAARQR